MEALQTAHKATAPLDLALDIRRATAVRPDHRWLDLSAFGRNGELHRRVVVDAAESLCVVGLPVLLNRKSSFIRRVGHDVRELFARLRTHLAVYRGRARSSPGWPRSPVLPRLLKSQPVTRFEYVNVLTTRAIQTSRKSRVIAGSVSLSVVAACAAPPPSVPVALDPGVDQRALMQLSATGVQVYECRADGGAGTVSWTLVAPQARLLDPTGRVVGHHGAGPSWVATDGSRVVGTVQARVDAPVAASIPWLLLRTRSTGGPGAFEQVTSIQRLDTEGGVAPASGCTPGSLGAQAHVPYRAVYQLYVPA